MDGKRQNRQLLVQDIVEDQAVTGATGYGLGLSVVAAGRLPCPLCGQPLDPQGHICTRRNGHYVN